jgi:hypothetical protein
MFEILIYYLANYGYCIIKGFLVVHLLFRKCGIYYEDFVILRYYETKYIKRLPILTLLQIILSFMLIPQLYFISLALFSESEISQNIKAAITFYEIIYLCLSMITNYVVSSLQNGNIVGKDGCINPYILRRY